MLLIMLKLFHNGQREDFCMVKCYFYFFVIQSAGGMADFCRLYPSLHHPGSDKNPTGFWIVAENKLCDQHKCMILKHFVYHDRAQMTKHY